MSPAPRHETPRPPAAPPAPADRLRHDIDSGRTGDKVAASDPAAAPLGTDDEAGGTPPTRHRVATARQHDVQEEVGLADKTTSRVWWMLLAIAGACLVALAAAVMLGR